MFSSIPWHLFVSGLARFVPDSLDCRSVMCLLLLLPVRLPVQLGCFCTSPRHDVNLLVKFKEQS